jgi:anti-sigma B factor antagonist
VTDQTVTNDLTDNVHVSVLQVPVELFWKTQAQMDALGRELMLLNVAAEKDHRSIPSRMRKFVRELGRAVEMFGSGTMGALTTASEQGITEADVHFVVPRISAGISHKMQLLLAEADAYCSRGDELLTLVGPPEFAMVRHWFLGEVIRQCEQPGAAPIPWPTYLREASGASARDATLSTGGDGLGVALSWDGDLPLLTAEGDLDLLGAPALHAAVQELRDRGATTIALDLSGVDFLDSVGISVLIAVRQRLGHEGGGLILRQVSAQTRRTLDMAGITSMFQLDT